MWTAIFPAVFGWVTGQRGYMLVIWLCAGIQFLAVLVNLPLLFHPLLKRTPEALLLDDNDKSQIQTAQSSDEEAGYDYTIMSDSIDADEDEIQNVLDV